MSIEIHIRENVFENVCKMTAIFCLGLSVLINCREDSPRITVVSETKCWLNEFK